MLIENKTILYVYWEHLKQKFHKFQFCIHKPVTIQWYMQMYTLLYNAISSESTITMFFSFAVISVAVFFMITWLSRPKKKKKSTKTVQAIPVMEFYTSVIKVLFLPSMWISAILCFFSLIKMRKQDKSAQILRSITSSYFDFFDAVGN